MSQIPKLITDHQAAVAAGSGAYLVVFEVPYGLVYRVHAVNARDAVSVCTVQLLLHDPNDPTYARVVVLDSQELRGIQYIHRAIFRCNLSGGLPLDVPGSMRLEVRFDGCVANDDLLVDYAYEIIEGVKAQR